MIQRSSKTILFGLIIALVLAACQQGPGANSATQQTEESNNLTRTFMIRSSQFQVVNIGSVGFAVVEYSFPELTAEIVSRGLVHAHIQSNEPGDVTWTTLPFSVTVGVSTTITLDVTYGYTTGKIGFSIYSNVPASLLRTGLSAVDGWKLRVVVDPS